MRTRPGYHFILSGSEKISSARFYDNRQNYLSFINTTNEKWKIAERAVKELAFLKPTPPALRVFDAGMGDATILTHLMRSLHRRYPIMPFFMKSYRPSNLILWTSKLYFLHTT